MLRVDPASLAFPAGVAPGFDPTHIAAPGIRFSGAAIPAGGFVSLLNGKPGANASSPTAAIDSGLGPATNYPAGTFAVTSFSGNPAVTDASLTMAAIVKFTAVNTAAFQYIISGGAGGTGNALALNTTGALLFVRFGGSSTTSILSPIAGVPYFIVASNNGATGTNFVIARLDNGSVLTDTKGSAANLASNGTYNIGESPSGDSPTRGLIAAAMISAQYISMQALQRFAADPWSFWYPAGP